MSLVILLFFYVGDNVRLHSSDLMLENTGFGLELTQHFNSSSSAIESVICDTPLAQHQATYNRRVELRTRGAVASAIRQTG